MAGYIWKAFLLFFFKFSSYLVSVLGIRSINISSLSRKRYCADNFILIPRWKYIIGNRVNWTYWAIWCIELQEIFQTSKFTNYINYFTYYVKKIFSENWANFYIFVVWFGVTFSVIVLKILCFWCFLWKVIVLRFKV